MLKACAHISPRGVFVCGNSTTEASLTVNNLKKVDINYLIFIQFFKIKTASSGYNCLIDFITLNILNK